MIDPMAKIEVVGPMPHLQEVIDHLHQAGCVQVIEEVPSAERGEGEISRVTLSESETQDRRELEELLAQLRVVGPHISPEERERSEHIDEHRTRVAGKGTAELRQEFLPLCESFRQQLGRIENIRDDIELLKRYRSIVDTLAQVGVGEGYRSRSVIFESSQEEELEKAAEEANRLTDGEMRLEKGKIGKGRQVAVFVFPARFDDQVGSLLWEARLNEVVFPDEYREKPADVIREDLEKRLERLPSELAAAEISVEEFLREHSPALIAAGERVTELVEKYNVRTRFAKTEYAFGVTGWVPLSELGGFERSILDSFGGKVVVNRLSIDEHKEAIPTKLRNRGAARPFSTLLRIFPPPAYGTLDPSWLMVVTVPLFLGYMVGDEGYGALMFLISLWVYWKFGKRSQIVADIAIVYMLVGVASIIFGYVFSEVFGNLVSAKAFGDPHEFWGITGRETASQQKAYLGVAIFFGLVHMTISLVFGMINHWRQKKAGHLHAGRHFLEKLAFLLFTYGIFFFALTFVEDLRGIGELLAGLLGSIEVLRYVSYALLVVACLILAVVISPPGIGILEGLGMISNVLSYARLMAVGIASVVLANIANSILYGTEGTAWWPVGLIGMILVHLLNLFLVFFDPTIQGLRLHYVEFFMRFYEPTGVPFTPFRKKGGI
jgi:V/A-type H+-transporting ATPase subunit I